MANELQQTKMQIAIAPAAIVDDAAFTSNVIDKLDFPGADYIEVVGVFDADAEMAQLRVMESDEQSDATTLGGTPSLVKDSTVKPDAASSPGLFVFGIDLKAQRKRYLQLQATAGDGAAGTFLTAIAVGRRLMEAGSGADRRGLLFAEYA